MKKLSILLAILSCSLTFAQEKKYNFDQKLTYQLKGKEVESMYQNINLINYYSKDALFGILNTAESWSSNSNSSFLSVNNKIYDVITNNLENNLSIKFTYDYWSDNNDENLKPYSSSFFGDVTKVIPLNTTSTYGAYTCKNYELSYEVSNYGEYYEYPGKDIICIDEKNSINNINLLIPNHNLKGLLINLKNEDKDFSLVLDKIEKASATISFDEKAETDKFYTSYEKAKQEYAELYNAETVVDSAVAVADYYSNNAYDHPFCSYYNYYSDQENIPDAIYQIYTEACSELYNDEKDYKKLIKESKKLINQKINFYAATGSISKSDKKIINNVNKKLFKEADKFKLEKDDQTGIDYAAVAADTAVAADYAEIVGETYKSTYKNLEKQPISLAMEFTDEYKDYIPAYCKELNIPDFKNQDFKYYVKNYVGQVCDLYSIPYDQNVAVKETIDIMRNSLIKINELKEKQTKQDQMLFDQFINNLD